MGGYLFMLTHNFYFSETDLNASFSYLREAQVKLQNAVRQRFNEAVEGRNRSQVERLVANGLGIF